VAEASDGTLQHIDDVPSGLACDCTCPACERRMVAKKGPIQAHHFAHYSDRNDSSCTSAGETALHKYAKKILDQRLEIGLPEMVVSGDGDREVVVQATKLKFDRAVLEVRDGSIVPDVVLELRDRRLIIEFRVTHACDDVKIARIRAMNVGAIEIDLSQYRDRPLDEIRDDILHTAPRAWLHNPREPDARERLAQRSRQRAEDRKRVAEDYRAKYRHCLPAIAATDGACEAALRRDGLEELVNLNVDGAGCFTVPVAEWQAAVVLDMLASKEHPFRTRNGLAALVRRRWVDPHFRSVPDHVSKALKGSGLPFAPPAEAVEAYLRQLEQMGFVRSAPSEIWQPSQALRSKVRMAKDLRARPAKRLAEICEIVKEELEGLPAEETGSFTFGAWVKSVLPGRPPSVADAIQGSESEWRSLCQDISNIGTNIRFSPRIGLPLFGLPLDGKLVRALERKRQEAEERERGRVEKEQAEADARVLQLRSRAHRSVGDLAGTWLANGNPALDGLSPLEAASSATGFDAALIALDRKRRELELEEHERRRKQKAVAELEALARSRYYDPEHAELWMRSSRRELGGISPAEFTHDDATRDKCATYLPPKRSRR
jgi:competence protein CoiA-like protein